RRRQERWAARAPSRGSRCRCSSGCSHASYWWGQIYLDNKGNESVQVESLDLGQIPAGMSVLGSYAIKAGTGPSGFGEGYPPSQGQPVEGLVIPPGAVYEVIVGLKATTTGRTVIP